MEYLFAVVLIMAGLLGASALIVAKKPDAQRIIDSLLPFQALIGAGALVLSVVMIMKVGPKEIFLVARTFPLMGASFLAGVIAGLMLGLMFAIPLMGRLGAGQQRAAELAAKLAPWQLLIGIAALGAGVLIILFRSGILPPHFPSSTGIGL
jgi:hypothetical protein